MNASVSHHLVLHIPTTSHLSDCYLTRRTFGMGGLQATVSSLTVCSVLAGCHLAALAGSYVLPGRLSSSVASRGEFEASIFKAKASDLRGQSKSH